MCIAGYFLNVSFIVRDDLNSSLTDNLIPLFNEMISDLNIVDYLMITM